MTWLPKKVFAISAAELSFERRGFCMGEPRVRARLEGITAAVLHGYRAALASEGAAPLSHDLDLVTRELSGFAFEGAAMALALLDLASLGKKHRWSDFLAGIGEPHAYMLHAGRGLALARLRRAIREPLRDADPLFGWLAADGYGFHAGFFDAPKTRLGDPPACIGGYARRAFDQGLGRSLWFSQCADVELIARAIASCSAPRRGDFWSGVGLACAYAGGIERSSISDILSAAGSHAPEAAQGAAFAAEARARAGNPAAHTEEACSILCGCSAEHAASITRAERLALERDDPVLSTEEGRVSREENRVLRGESPLKRDGRDRDEPAYETWRRRIQARFQVRELAR